MGYSTVYDTYITRQYASRKQGQGRLGGIKSPAKSSVAPVQHKEHSAQNVKGRVEECDEK